MQCKPHDLCFALSCAGGFCLVTVEFDELCFRSSQRSSGCIAKTMPAPPPSGYAYGGPSCWTRMKTGFMIGFCVGVASGALFGGFSALRSVL